MQIELGKYYRTACGALRGPMAGNTKISYPGFPFMCPKSGDTFTTTGHFYADMDSSFDLIEEVEELAIVGDNVKAQVKSIGEKKLAAWEHVLHYPILAAALSKNMAKHIIPVTVQGRDCPTATEVMQRAEERQKAVVERLMRGDNAKPADTAAPQPGGVTTMDDTAKQAILAVDWGSEDATVYKIGNRRLRFADLAVNGYQSLAAVMEQAHDRAARGKGKERHASQGVPFEEQGIVRENEILGGIEGQLYQIRKKAFEAARMARADNTAAAVGELLDIMNYAAAAVVQINN